MEDEHEEQAGASEQREEHDQVEHAVRLQL